MYNSSWISSVDFSELKIYLAKYTNGERGYIAVARETIIFMAVCLYGRRMEGAFCVAVVQPLYGRRFIWTADLYGRSLLCGDHEPRRRHLTVSPLNPFILKSNPVSSSTFIINHVSLSTTRHHQLHIPSTHRQHLSIGTCLESPFFRFVRCSFVFIIHLFLN
jgi:hypothetical protein